MTLCIGQMLMGEFRPGTEKELRKQDEKERVAALFSALFVITRV